MNAPLYLAAFARTALYTAAASLANTTYLTQVVHLYLKPLRAAYRAIIKRCGDARAAPPPHTRCKIALARRGTARRYRYLLPHLITHRTCRCCGAPHDLTTHAVTAR